jgi:hypothetical protein
MSGKPDPQRFLLSLRKQGGLSRAYWGLPEQYYIRSTRAAGANEARSSGMQQGIDTHGSGHKAQDWNGARNDGLDWQALFRVSSNWRKGRFAFAEIPNPTEQDVAPSSAERSEQAELLYETTSRNNSASDVTVDICPGNSTSSSDRDVSNRSGATLLMESAGNLVFTASRSVCEDEERPGHSAARAPCVKVYLFPDSSNNRAMAAATQEEATATSPALELRSKDLRAAVSSRKLGMPTITDIKADTASSSADVRLFVAYSSGDWSVFHLTMDPWADIAATEELFCSNSSPTSAQRPSFAVMSSFHYPILATCTVDFDITIYSLDDHSNSVSGEGTLSARLLRRMKGSNCHWPASMSLASLAAAHSDSVKSHQQRDGRKRKRAPSPTHQDLEHRSRTGDFPSFVGIREARKRRRQCEARMPLPSTNSLDLSAELSEPNQAFRLDVAYSTPCYPDNWSISLQEIVILLNGLGEGGSVSINSRYATARPRLMGQLRRPDTSQDEGCLEAVAGDDLHSFVRGTEPPRSTSRQADAPRSIFSSPRAGSGVSHGHRPLYGRTRITSIINDEKTLVAGSVDNSLDVYTISGSMKRAPPTPSAGATAPPLQDLTLEHHQILHGHGASVSSVALSGNRIVSGSKDGNIMVWTLKQSSDLVPAGSQAHAITLRTPSPNSTPLLPSTDAALPSTLYRLLAQAKAVHYQRTSRPAQDRMPIGQGTSSISPSQVKRVSTTFDRILSVTGIAGPDPPVGTAEYSALKSDRAGEQVDNGRGEKLQIWSFAG